MAILICRIVLVWSPGGKSAQPHWPRSCMPAQEPVCSTNLSEWGILVSLLHQSAQRKQLESSSHHSHTWTGWMRSSAAELRVCGAFRLTRVAGDDNCTGHFWMPLLWISALQLALHHLQEDLLPQLNCQWQNSQNLCSALSKTELLADSEANSIPFYPFHSH